MLLSEIVRRFFVLPPGQSEIAGFGTEDHPELGEVIVLTWNDSDTGHSYRLEFVDQGVRRDAVGGCSAPPPSTATSWRSSHSMAWT